MADTAGTVTTRTRRRMSPDEAAAADTVLTGHYPALQITFEQFAMQYGLRESFDKIRMLPTRTLISIVRNSGFLDTAIPLRNSSAFHSVFSKYGQLHGKVASPLYDECYVSCKSQSDFLRTYLAQDVLKKSMLHILTTSSVSVEVVFGKQCDVTASPEVIYEKDAFSLNINNF